MNVPFLDILEGDSDIGNEISAALLRVQRSGRYLLGAELEAFEMEFAANQGVSEAVGVGSGLDALTLMLRALGIGSGDEIIVPAHTFIATWFAVSHVGATPIPVDCDPKTLTIDPLKVENAITDRSVAILPVHLYGRPADMKSLRRIARKYGLVLVADGAQSVGAEYDSKPIAQWAEATAVSFYPGKNLGAYGDGGAVLTDSKNLAGKIRALRNYGGLRKYQHDEVGVNSRLSEIQAAVLRVKLPSLSVSNQLRRRQAARYQDGLEKSNLSLPPRDGRECQSAWHLFTVQIEKRDVVKEALQALGIETSVHYPVPPHLTEAYRTYRYPSMPISERVSREILSLPIGPHLKSDQLDYVISCLEDVSRNGDVGR